MELQIIFPIALILVGGTLLFWWQFFTGQKTHLWAMPWLFSAVVAGGYLGWIYSSGAPTLGRVVLTTVGCILGFLAGILGFITDPGEIEEGPAQQYVHAMFLLSLPIGVILGTLIWKIWALPQVAAFTAVSEPSAIGTFVGTIRRIPGPAIGFCLLPLLLSISAVILYIPLKLLQNVITLIKVKLG